MRAETRIDPGDEPGPITYETVEERFEPEASGDRISVEDLSDALGGLWLDDDHPEVGLARIVAWNAGLPLASTPPPMPKRWLPPSLFESQWRAFSRVHE